MPTQQQLVDKFHEHGFVVLEKAISPADVDAIREELDVLLNAYEPAATRTDDKAFAGTAVRRVYDPLARTRLLDPLVLHPVVNALLDELLDPRRQLGMTIASRIDGRQPAQGLHYDAGVYPLRALGREVEVNAIWALDRFERANGATIVVPGSHRWEPGRRPTDTDERAAVLMEPGSVLIYSGNLWHGSGENSSGARRLGLILEHVLAWLRPAENHGLALPETTLRSLPTELLDLVGLSQPSPYFGFVGGRHPQAWLLSRGRVAD